MFNSIYFHISETDISLRNADIPTISAALKRLYGQVFSKTRTSPLDSKSLKKLDDIYVNLTLIKDKKTSQERHETISYEQIFQILEDTDTITRVAFLGEAGVGKTTLLSKIAHDWATGKHLAHVELLFFVPLREIDQPLPLCDILQRYAARGMDFNKDRVEEYVRAHQRKVLLLLDGLDEYSEDIRDENLTNVLVGIIRGDKLKSAPVIITTRPWRAEQITTPPTIRMRYSRIEIKGFKKKDVKDYISKYFQNDQNSAKGIVKLMTENNLIASNMAPYPIFCCMLCNMWQEESRRGKIQILETFSQLFEEMISSLTEHWLSKNSFRDYRRRCQESFKQIGEVAFEGLLMKKLVFTQETFEGCLEAMKTGCEIGVLSAENRFEPTGVDTKHTKTHISFPHKLFQEYLAGMYLDALYLADQSHFWKCVNGNIIPNYHEFRYLLYFTVSHGKEPGHAGKAVIDGICEQINDEEFIADLIHEFHGELALPSVAKYFRENCTHLRLSQRLQLLEKHTWSGYMCTLQFCGREMVSFVYLVKDGSILKESGDFRGLESNP